ncbi:MAG: glycosyltransferase family 4 protein [Anaerolineales bacterium]|nr:MAG: glycosyltransferase family 4 protein [Anaerolineales bacterium]
MRIAYVTVHVAPEIMQGGVGKKIKSQMGIWREIGHEVTLFSLSPAEIPFPEERQFIFDANVNLLKREVARMFELKRMLEAIREFQPDVIYMRFGLYSHPLHRLFKIAPVVLETNSDDRQEYQERGAFFHWMNRLTRGLTFGSAAGIIFPSHELVDVLLPKRDKPFRVISNGIDVRKVKIMPPPKNPHPVITLVGSPGMDWHGVDKLIDLAGLFQDLEVNIIGYSKSDIDIPYTENVHFLGFLFGDELHEILCKTDVMCGTLALHRKKMNEASPLKVREAISFGIPLIIAYYDTDLSELEIETMLRLPNTENNILENSSRIRKFAYDMMGKRVDVNAVFSYLDQRKKEETRLAFFEEILAERT